MTGEEVNFVPNPTHDYIDVEDVVSGILNLQGRKGIYELGTGITYTNQHVLNLVENIVGAKANIKVVNYLRDYDIKDWRCKNFYAQEYGWKPKKTLEQSIQEQARIMKAAIR